MDRVEKSINNSCLMMAMNLETPVGLGYLFDKEDLHGTGVEVESHVTLLYASGIEIPKSDLLKDIEVLLGPREFDVLMKKLEEAELFPEDWFGTIWELGSFSNDSDYLILKLTNSSDPTSDWIRSTFGVINKGLKRKWGIESEYTYTPHITLAELKLGTVRKYLEDSRIYNVLSDSLLSWSDLVLSIGPSGDGVRDRIQYNLTSYNAIDRYFQLEELRKELKQSEEE